MAGGKRRLRAGILLGLTLACSACDTVSGVTDKVFGPGNAPAQGQPGFVQGFLGGVVADEPRAALAARQVLSAGGTAADAAVALGFVLSVTLPSRAGLGGGGACLAYAADKKSVNEGVPEAVLFPPVAPTSAGANADRPAAVPMLARGLYLLHARYGTLPFESLIVPAEQLARFGTPAPRALVRDIALVAGPLLADPNARAVFSQGGAPLAEGQTLLQPELGATLAQIRVSGVGDLYTGALARRIVQASPLAGGPLALADLNGALPKIAPAIGTAEPARQGRLPSAARGWRPGRRSGLRNASTRSISARHCRCPLARRVGTLAARWRGCPEPADRDGPDSSGAAPAAGLHQLCDTRQEWQRGRVFAQHGQSVRHRPDIAWTRYPACRIPCRGSPATLFGGDRLERQCPRLPRGGWWLGPARSTHGSSRRDAECPAHHSANGRGGA